MLLSTKAIVLRLNKYSDSSVIVQLFTKDAGRVSVMVYGIKNKKKSKLTAFQSLYLLDVVIDLKHNRSIQILKEHKLSPVLVNLSSSPAKISIALFLSEFLTKCLQEESADKQTFDFLYTSIKILNEIEHGIGIFHLAFLIKFSKYLGFNPTENNEDFNFYDFKKNKGLITKPSHSFFVNRSEFNMLNLLLNTPYNKLNGIKLLATERDKLLKTIILMYELHAIHFSSIKSFEILKQVFRK